MPRYLHLILVVLLALPAAAQARVTPPPRPVGSDQLEVHPGLQEAERARAIRAHRAHPIHPRPAASMPRAPLGPHK